MDTKPLRRIQDSLDAKNPTHKMNLERRFKNNERRDLKKITVDAPARRLTIDRRLKTGDRRKINEE
ncbi:MAG: hypothetical protein OQL06_11470 [Gammaproteobacteria bacterium]|nr:hypothetical protein [Gammaproteobacteria bacterium]